MSLGNEKYNELLRDEFVQTAIVMMKVGMSFTPKKMHRHEKDSQLYAKQLISDTIQKLKNFIDNDILVGGLKLDKKILLEFLGDLQHQEESIKDQNKKRINKYFERNIWLTYLFTNLIKLGLNKQADRVDFAYRTIKENDLQGFTDYKYIRENKDIYDIDDYYDSNRESIKRVLRKIDSSVNL